MNLRRPTPLVGLVVLALFVTACGGSSKTTSDAGDGGRDGPVRVTDVWARPGDAGGTTAIYATIHGGADADELTGVDAGDGFADSVEMHETVEVGPDATDDDADGDIGGADHHDGHENAHGDHGTPGGGLMTMRPVHEVAVPAGGQVSFAPGGLHVMVTGLAGDLAVGDTFPVSFEFEHAGAITVDARVRE